MREKRNKIMKDRRGSTNENNVIHIWKQYGSISSMAINKHGCASQTTNKTMRQKKKNTLLNL